MMELTSDESFDDKLFRNSSFFCLPGRICQFLQDDDHIARFLMENTLVLADLDILELNLNSCNARTAELRGEARDKRRVNQNGIGTVSSPLLILLTQGLESKQPILYP